MPIKDQGGMKLFENSHAAYLGRGVGGREKK